MFAPQGSAQVSYEEMPEMLARFKTFVHLPSVLEPFGRSTVEAWAAGCEVVVNSLVGGRYWITEAPEKLETAAEDFWACVLDS
jgi:glycosyltransferase involved in cell wall biosynthesis